MIRLQPQASWDTRENGPTTYNREREFIPVRWGQSVYLVSKVALDDFKRDMERSVALPSNRFGRHLLREDNRNEGTFSADSSVPTRGKQQ